MIWLSCIEYSLRYVTGDYSHDYVEKDILLIILLEYSINFLSYYSSCYYRNAGIKKKVGKIDKYKNVEQCGWRVYLYLDINFYKSSQACNQRIYTHINGPISYNQVFYCFKVMWRDYSVILNKKRKKYIYFYIHIYIINWTLTHNPIKFFYLCIFGAQVL